jgi:hypothetical protein
MLMPKIAPKPNVRNVLTRLRLNGGALATEAADVIEYLTRQLDEAKAMLARRGDR